ncbi:hypothetical protein CY34DRAFT_17907 [Suillus luteus UH-Slu-Lm8-n1]|uniref:DUF6818 domain-containing protein n=1 Tax=Suillus luteus UH-Slu-Lm8-n1 TaxID=930992 RepID=A0A0D0AQA5_9AGAM|nr:hypothetical protein CY34DRAFT_17907 [Suillus luteus UH-Slu-Lm8-n1]
MSDIPPPQSMIPPGSSPSYLELHYNNVGNVYAHNEDNVWVSHLGICKPPSTYTLTLAKFQFNLDTTPPSQPSGSRVPLCQVPTNQMIDPVLLPLPDSPDFDLTDAVTIVEAHGHTLAVTTAGSHHQVKGPRAKGMAKKKIASANSKKCFQEDAEDNDEVSDVKVLLDIVCQELPLGQREWQAVHVKFGQWEKANGQPKRKITSLEMKFKQLVKTMKPTGDGVCPPEVTRAHHIDQLINKHAGTHDLDDMDFDDIEDNNDHSILSDQIQDKLDCTSPSIQHTTLACSTAHTEAPIPHRNARGAAATDLLNCLSGALDPAAQCDHDEDRANRSFATMQLLTQSQQLRDSNASIETYRDNSLLHIKMMEMTGSTHCQHIWMPKHKNLQQEWFPDGGGSVRWITDEGESTESEAPKAPHLRRVGPFGRPKYSDRPYFEDLADEPPKPIQKEGSQEI